MVRVVISGPRTCTRKDDIFSVIKNFIDEIGGAEEIVAGGSTGVDLIARMYAESTNIKYTEFAPNWQDDLNAAGMVRDSRMAEYGTHLLVISDGKYKGSNNLIHEAERNGLTIKEVPFSVPLLPKQEQKIMKDTGKCFLS